MKKGSKELVHALAWCIHMCNECMNACLDEEDVKMMKECIRLDKQCADVCLATLSLVYKDGRFNREIIMLCKNACIVCAEECGKHQFEHCQKCAEACQDCVRECERMLEEGREKSGMTGQSCGA